MLGFIGAQQTAVHIQTLQPVPQHPVGQQALTPLLSPPDMMHTALPSPTLSAMAALVWLMKASSVHQGVRPQTSVAKRISRPIMSMSWLPAQQGKDLQLRMLGADDGVLPLGQRLHALGQDQG